MDNINIVNLEDTSFAMKLLTSDRAEKMIENGKLYFSCSKKWSTINKVGQGDKLEGVFAKINIENKEVLKLYKLHYGETLDIEYDENYMYLRNKNLCYLPSYCFYSLKNKFWNINGDPYNAVSGTTDISKEICRDFSNKKSSIVIIKDQAVFINQIIKQFEKKGISKEKVIIEYIKYKDLEGQYYKMDNNECELFVKNKCFSYQREVRILINSQSLKFKDYDEGFSIYIGNMSSYAELLEGYFPEGLRLESEIELVEIKD